MKFCLWIVFRVEGTNLVHGLLEDCDELAGGMYKRI